MTMQEWAEKVCGESYNVKYVSAELAVAYKIDPPPLSLSRRVPEILFCVYYMGEERTCSIYMMTDVGQLNPHQWYPLHIESTRVVSRCIQVEVMADLGPYYIDFDFSNSLGSSSKVRRT